MSTTTPYLGLTLYDSTTDQVVTFATFRAVWGGTATTSNFYKIDTAVSGLNTRVTVLESSPPPITVNATFSSANYYVATVAAITAYNTGMTIIISLDTTSSGTVTLGINLLGTKSLVKIDSSGATTNLTGSDMQKGRKYVFQYNGSAWQWVNASTADQINIDGTSGNVVTVNSDNTLLGTTTQSSLISTTTHAATSKTTPVGADEIGIIDSAASNVLKKLTFTNLITYLINSLLKFGDGRDGNVTITGSTTTLTRDMYYNDLTLSSAGILKTAGYRVYVKGVLTIDGTSSINMNGSNGSDGISGSEGTGAGGVGGSSIVSGLLGTGASGGMGGSGGTSGGNNSTRGLGGACNPAFSYISIGGSGGGGGAGHGLSPSNAIDGSIGRIGTFSDGTGAFGGVGSGNQGGGGGGQGGGVVLIYASVINNGGTISTNGGVGGNAGGSVAGVGGGGSGGASLVFYGTTTGSGVGTVTASGGSYGTGTGSTSGATNGAAGVTITQAI